MTVQKGSLKCIALLIFLLFHLGILNIFDGKRFSYFTLCVQISFAHSLFSSHVFVVLCLLCWHFEKPSVTGQVLFSCHLILNLRVQIFSISYMTSPVLERVYDILCSPKYPAWYMCRIKSSFMIKWNPLSLKFVEMRFKFQMSVWRHFWMIDLSHFLALLTVQVNVPSSIFYVWCGQTPQPALESAVWLTHTMQNGSSTKSWTCSVSVCVCVSFD